MPALSHLAARWSNAYLDFLICRLLPVYIIMFSWMLMSPSNVFANVVCRNIYWIIYFPFRINANGIEVKCFLFIERQQVTWKRKNTEKTITVDALLNGLNSFYTALQYDNSLSSQKNKLDTSPDRLDISVKSRFCSSWMEQTALCESDNISSYSIAGSRQCRTGPGWIPPGGLPSMQTAFPHTASLYITQWLHHIHKGWDVWGCQGQENRAVRWKINVGDERRHTTPCIEGTFLILDKSHLLSLKTHFSYF